MKAVHYIAPSGALVLILITAFLVYLPVGFRVSLTEQTPYPGLQEWAADLGEGLRGFRIVDTRPDLLLKQAAPGAASLSASREMIFALDPLVWIYDRNRLSIDPRRENITDLEEMLSALASDGNPALYIPGDEPAILLPILVMLEEGMSGRIPSEVMDNWQDYMSSPRSWRERGSLEQAYQLLDRWVGLGILASDWWDVDSSALNSAVSRGLGSMYLNFQSWLRQRSNEERFSWSVAPVIPGPGRTSFRITARALEIDDSQLRSRHENRAAEYLGRLRAASSATSLAALGLTPLQDQGPYLNREDRDSRMALKAASGWMLVGGP